MANEAEIINNPTSIPEAVSTGYQRQNTMNIADRVGMDFTILREGTGKVTLEISGPVDVNGVLYTIKSQLDLAIVGAADRYWIYLAGAGDNLTPTLTTTAPIFDESKNAHYTAGNLRVLNWTIWYDGTDSHVNYFNHGTPEEFYLVANGTWKAPYSKYYEIMMTGRGGNGGLSNLGSPAGGGGGAGATGRVRIFIEAGTVWTAVFSAASGLNCTFSDGVTTLSIQNGYIGGAGAGAGGGIGGGGGVNSIGMDIRFRGGDGTDATEAHEGSEQGGNGGASFYAGGGRGGTKSGLGSTNGVNGKQYGSGGGGSSTTGAVAGVPGIGGAALIIIKG